MEFLILKGIVTIFALAIGVILLCHRLKIPSIVGLLLTGVLAGPHALRLVHHVEDVEIFATMGIVLLLFSVGMEFSLKKILENKRLFFMGGLYQILFTIAASFSFGWLIERPLGESLFLGFLLSLSSTAIVLRALEERGEGDTPHGRLVLGVLIFQDIVAIPMLLLTPLLGGSDIQLDLQFFSEAALSLGVLGGVLIAANTIVPRFLYLIAKTRSRELFLLSVLTICFSIAWLTSSIGLSLSLGAFLAGLIISESEYRHEALGDVLPFQDVFTSFFFISIGMLLDIDFLLSQPFLIPLLATSILLLKTVTGAAAAVFLGMPLRSAILTGIALSQIGEFSFVLAKNGFQYELADHYRYQLFLAVSLLTMGVTPTLISASQTIADFILRLPFPSRLKTGLLQSLQTSSLENHLLIIGFGMCGRNLAHAAKANNIPYKILEMNPLTVRQEKLKGEPIYFGDATHRAVLQHVYIETARSVVVAINDNKAACRIVKLIRQMNTKIHIIVRTPYFANVSLMKQLGANEVISDELGASIEIFSRAMRLFEAPHEKIEEMITHVRTNYEPS